MKNTTKFISPLLLLVFPLFTEATHGGEYTLCLAIYQEFPTPALSILPKLPTCILVDSESDVFGSLDKVTGYS